MSDLDIPEGKEQSLNVTGTCTYCGSQLDPHYYFCVRCAQPYKNIAEILPKKAVFYESDSEKIQKKVPFVYNFFWLYFGVLFFTNLALYFLLDEEQIELSVYLPTIVLLILTLFISIRYWKTLWVLLKKDGIINRYFPLSLIVLAGFLVVNYYYHWIFYKMMGDESIYTTLKNSGMNTFTWAVLFCLFPAVTEEIAFRGLLQTWLTTALETRKAIMITAALFAMLHFSVISFPYLFFLGALFGVVRWKTESLYPGMILHFVHNFVVIYYFNY